MYFLYRHYSESGDLLYIGQTADLDKRNSEHLRNSPWRCEIHEITHDHYETLKDVVAAEKESILVESPKHNQQHNSPVKTVSIQVRAEPEDRDKYKAATARRI